MENHRHMKKVVLVALAAMCLPWFAPGASATSVETGGRIVAGGGTPLSNGLFFPGTALPRNGGGFDGLPPLEVKRGTNVEFTNLDEATVANGHKMVSLKRRKGRPLFASALLKSPGETDLVVTSNLKLGVYPFYCSVHAGMWGRIRIVR